jgi:hypothetical protein
MKLASFAHHFANKQLLGRVEALFSPQSHLPISHPPIFFLGAPRSGSTLAMQTITECFDLGYLSNCHATWYGFPSLAEKLFRPTGNRPNSNFKSLHGDVEGHYAPSECGKWWYRFFRSDPSYIKLEEINTSQMQLFRKSIASLTNAFDRPVIYKNLYASLRIHAIAQFIPESLFIVTHRNEVDNGHSLLEVRQKVLGDYTKWWSMKPPEYERLKKLPSHEQVIEQVRHIKHLIETDLGQAKVSSSRIFNLSFDELCLKPSQVIDDFEKFLYGNGCNISRNTNPPTEFEQRKDIKIERNLFLVMKSYAESN